MLDTIKNNPAASTAVLRGLLMAVMTAAIAFGAPITPTERDAVIELGSALVAVASLVSGITIATTVPKVPTANATEASIQQPPPPGP